MAVAFRAFRLNTAWCVVLTAATIGVAADAPAQQPSQAQLNALRSSCRSDYMAHCSSVPTGGAPALNCLKQHMSALSSGCQSAVNAISPAPAPAAAAAPATAPATAPAAAATPPPQTTQPAPPPVMQAAPAASGAAAARKPSPAQRQAEVKAISRACRADYRVHCAGIPPGGSASVACLKRNVRTLSRDCLQALVAAPAVAAAPAAPAAPAPAAAPARIAAPPPVEPAPLLVTPREERFIIRSACGDDYARYCGGLRPGLGRIAACLHYNRNNLSPRCQQALIALHEGRR
ncbi:MAG TPA: cysteine rich repeat-containing protein [Pseudolabrys sp.]|nr:cysteine rich repeat-containing protein [Pseudolabrys sp.]